MGSSELQVGDFLASDHGDEAWRLADGRLRAADDGRFVAEGNSTILEYPGLRLELQGSGEFSLVDGRLVDWGHPAELSVEEVTDEALAMLGIDSAEHGLMRFDPISGLWTVVSGGFVRDGIEFRPGRRFDWNTLGIRTDGERTGLREDVALREDRTEKSTSSEVRQVPSPETPADTRPIGGRVVDAMTRQPIENARVLLTYSHRPEGYPPIADESAQIWTRTQRSGEFVVPRFRPEDPRIQLHIQVDHPQFVVTAVVRSSLNDSSERRDSNGDWPYLEISARRALTRDHRFRDYSGEPLASVPVWVERVIPDPYTPSDLLPGERQRARSGEVLYTDDVGTLRLSDGWRRVESLLDSLLIPWSAETAGTPNWLSRARAQLAREDSALEPVIRVFVESPIQQSLLIADRSSLALSDSLVEVEIPDEGRLWMTRTDANGELRLGLNPDKRLPNPRTVRLRTLAPEIANERVSLLLPDPQPTVQLNRSTAPRVRLRLVDSEGDGVFPEQFTTDLDLTPVYRDRDGNIELVGKVPGDRSRIDVAIRDYLPTFASITPTPRARARIDLGEVLVGRGDEIELRWSGVSDRALELVLFDEQLFERHLNQPTGASPRSSTASRSWYYRLESETSGEGRFVIRGLEDGRRYRYSVRGPGVEPQEDEFVFAPTLAEKGIDIVLRLKNERRIRTMGQLSSADVQAWNRSDTFAALPGEPRLREQYRVIERYFLGTPDDPHVAASYPLSPDGRFGSDRVQPRARRTEILILSAGFSPESDREFARLGPQTSVQAVNVDFGTVSLVQTRRRAFLFFNPTLGWVPAPSDVSLLAQVDRNHELVHLREKSGALLARHLLPGAYQLQWTESSGRQGRYSFTVEADEPEQILVVPRPDYAGREVLISVVDPDEQPVTASVQAWPGSLPRGRDSLSPVRRPVSSGRDLGGGVYAVELSGDGSHVIRIESPPFLSASIELPRPENAAAIGPQQPVVLRAAAQLEARVRDVNEALFRGALSIDWEPDAVTSGDAIEYLRRDGATVVAVLERGDLNVTGLAPGARPLTFRAEASNGTVTLPLTLDPGRNRVARIDLEEHRAIRGVVYLPDGRPAENAEVALIALSADAPSFLGRLPLASMPPVEPNYRAQTDAQGFFEIDIVTTEADPSFVLVARKQGWLDAVEDPIDLRSIDRILTLGWGNELWVDAGYERGASKDYRFDLTYEPYQNRGGAQSFGPARLLGSIDALPRGAERLSFPNVAPGRYTLKWTLTEPHPDAQPVARSVEISEGVRDGLDLRLDLAFESATATFLGQRLPVGWLLLTDDPGDPDRTFWARVRDSEVLAPVPGGAGQLFAAVIPERDPIPTVDFSTGQARPIPIRRSVGHGLNIDYVAYDFELQFEPEFFGERPYLMLWPRLEWRFGSWHEVEAEPIPIAGPTLRYSLLSPGFWKYQIRESLTQGWTSARTTELVDDMILRVLR